MNWKGSQPILGERSKLIKIGKGGPAEKWLLVALRGVRLVPSNSTFALHRGQIERPSAGMDLSIIFQFRVWGRGSERWQGYKKWVRWRGGVSDPPSSQGVVGIPEQCFTRIC